MPAADYVRVHLSALLECHRVAVDVDASFDPARDADVFLGRQLSLDYDRRSHVRAVVHEALLKLLVVPARVARGIPAEDARNHGNFRDGRPRRAFILEGEITNSGSLLEVT